MMLHLVVDNTGGKKVNELPDISNLNASEIMRLAIRCMTKLSPADCLSVIIVLCPGHDLDELVDQLESEINEREVHNP